MNGEHDPRQQPSGGADPADPAPENPAPEGPASADTSAEAALRRMLQDSVAGVEPRPGALDHLQRAVPARRAHRRQAMAGACAAVVLGGVGLPLLLHSDVIPGDDDNRRVNAGSSHRPSEEPGGDATEPGETPGEASGGGHDTGGDERPGAGEESSEPPSGGHSSGPATGDTMVAGAPGCDRGQLGGATAEAGSPDGQGRVYGSFRVVNTSGETCTVEGAGLVDAAPRGRAGGDGIKVVDHAEGDPASGLPDPASEPEQLLLRSGEAYTIRFAWIPEDCPGGNPVPKDTDGDVPADDPPGGASGGESGGAGGKNPGVPENGGEGDGSPAESGSVQVTHTPDVGTPLAAATTIAGAASCEGTVYRTGVLAEK